MNHPSVTKELIESKIVDVKYIHPDTVTTICFLTLENGFGVYGHSACVSAENFVKEVGEKIAYDNAFEKIWVLEGYLLKEKIYREMRTEDSRAVREKIASMGREEKALGNTDANGTKKNVSDVVFFGNGDMFKLLCKASSVKQGWMKSTKAMEVSGGCVVQVTTQQGVNVSEAVTFVPNVVISEELNADGVVVGRRLV